MNLETKEQILKELAEWKHREVKDKPIYDSAVNSAIYLFKKDKLIMEAIKIAYKLGKKQK